MTLTFGDPIHFTGLTITEPYVFWSRSATFESCHFTGLGRIEAHNSDITLLNCTATAPGPASNGGGNLDALVYAVTSAVNLTGCTLDWSPSTDRQQILSVHYASYLWLAASTLRGSQHPSAISIYATASDLMLASGTHLTTSNRAPYGLVIGRQAEGIADGISCTGHVIGASVQQGAELHLTDGAQFDGAEWPLAVYQNPASNISWAGQSPRIPILVSG